MKRIKCNFIFTCLASLAVLIAPGSAYSAWDSLDISIPDSWTNESSTSCSFFDNDPGALCSLYYEDDVLKFSVRSQTINPGEMKFFNFGMSSNVLGPNDIKGIRYEARIDPLSDCLHYPSGSSITFGASVGPSVAIGTQTASLGAEVVTTADLRSKYSSVHTGTGKSISSIEDILVLFYSAAAGRAGDYASQEFRNLGAATDWSQHELSWQRPKELEFINANDPLSRNITKFNPTMRAVNTAILGIYGKSGNPAMYASFSIEHNSLGPIPMPETIPACTMEIRNLETRGR